MRRKAYIGAAVIAAVLVCAVVLIHIVRAQAFMAEAGQMAERLVAQKLGTAVHIGAVEIRSLHELKMDDVVIYDKQAEAVLRADEARVTLRLLSLLSSPETSIDEILLTGAHADLVQRADGSWNYDDIGADDTSPSTFEGRIRTEGGSATIVTDGRTYELTEIAGAVEIDRSDVSYKATGALSGVPLRVRGAYVGGNQELYLSSSDTDFMSLRHLLPENSLPEELQLSSLHADAVRMELHRVDGVLTMDGRIDGMRGAADVYGTQMQLDSAALRFNERAIFVAATAEAAEQRARVDGTIRLDTDAPYLDLIVRAQDFAVDRILADSPYQGAVTADLHVTGTLAAPTVTGKLTAAHGAVSDVSFQNATVDVAYADGTISFENLTAEAFGGTLSGTGVFTVEQNAYTAHLTVDNVALGGLRSLSISLPEELDGTLHADLGIDGQTGDALTIFGSAALSNGVYRNIPVERANASFILRGDDLTIDFLSARLPNDTELGVEGKITRGSALDLRFYGAHADLSLLNYLDERLSFSGLADFSGEVHGDIHDPQVDMQVSATNGDLMYQPFDSLLFRADGSLSGVGIYDFSMERGGREVWLVNGSIGFTGERRIDLQIDTIGARMEDVAALVAPDQPITGNIDNIIKFTGTLDNPHAVGYVHFSRGSYAGAVLSGMDGDYFLDNGIIRVQVFHIYSPMVDMVLNGTISAQGVLDFDAEVRDLDMKRFEHKLPYEVSGHGVFNGKVGGMISHPIFRGELKADAITMNGVELREIRGFVHFENGIIDLERTGFRQGADGSVTARLRYDTETRALRGALDIEKMDVTALLALANQNENRITGKITTAVQLGGTPDNPSIALTGEIAEGTIASYPVQKLALDVALSDRVLTISKFAGTQGDGSFSAVGTADFDGAANVDIAVSDIALGMLTRFAGVEQEVTGTVSLTAHVGGQTQHPEADLKLTAKNGGTNGATFDDLTGEAQLRGSVIRLNQLTVTKYIDGIAYAASAHGTLPLRALTADRDETLDAYDQIDLTIALDNADLSLIPVFSNQVEWALGRTEGSLKLHGTLAAPRLTGSLRVTGGAVKLRYFEHPLTDMQVRIDALGDALSVRECTGKMGAGTYLLTGRVEMAGMEPQSYDFTFVMNDLDLKTSFYEGPLSGTLCLTEGEYWGERLPALSGTIEIDRALVTIPSIPETDDELPHIMLDVGLTVGRHVHLFSPSFYDMHPSGSVHFGGTTRHPRTTGMIGVRRGDTVSYLRTVFKIREGTATFNQPESFLPEIAFYAEARLTHTRVFLSAHGPLDHMDFRLGSSPEMSEEEIIRMLTLRSAYANGEGGITAADILSIGLQMSILSEVEDSVKNFLHLDVLRLSSGSGALFETKDDEAVKQNENEYNVEIGKYFGDRVLLRYVQGLGAASDTHRIGIQYDFNDRFGISYDREGSDQFISFEARFRF